MECNTPVAELGGSARLESHVAGVAEERIRILFFNVRHCRGAFSPLVSEARTGHVIKACHADVVGLAEVYRTARRDQPALLEELLGLRSSVFHGVRPVRGGQYGNMLLSPHGVGGVRRIPLAGRREARGCLVTNVDTRLGTIAVAVTHLGLDAESRRGQVARLVHDLPFDRPLILMGDFNGRIRELEPLLDFLDTVPATPLTFPSVFPVAALDRVMFSADFELRAAWAPFTMASDHLPLLVELSPGPRWGTRA